MRELFSATVVACVLLFTLSSADNENNFKKQNLFLVDAVKSALANNYDVLVSQENIHIKLAERQEAQGTFDNALNASFYRKREFTPLPEIGKSEYKDGKMIKYTTGYSAESSRKFKTGTVWKNTISFEKSTDNAVVQQLPIANRGRIASGVSIPLLKGGNREAVTAQLDAATLALESQRYQNAHTLSTVAYKAASAYWDYLAAALSLEIHKDSEKRAAKLLEDTRKLVAADQVPRAELDQLEANLAQKTAVRLDAEQTLMASQHALGIIMGFEGSALEELPMPLDGFPALDSTVNVFRLQSVDIDEKALQYRNDQKSLEITKMAAAKMVRMAEDNLKADLNLQMELGYSGYAEGNSKHAYINGLTHKGAGMDVSGMLTYSWPTGNHSARGLYYRQKASLKQAELNLKKNGAQITSDVRVASSQLVNAVSRLDKVQRAMELYLKAVESEKKKFTLGMATLLDVIQIEDKLNDANIQMINAKKAYADAVLQLRFATGMLGIFSTENVQISEADLTRLPNVEKLESGD